MQEYIGSFFRAAFIIRLFLKVLFLQEEAIKFRVPFPKRKTVEFRVKIFSIRNKREKAARTKKDLGDWKTR